MTAYQAYIKYLAIKRHFTSDYDYFKYCGKVSATQKSFELRHDKYMFEKLSKISNIEDHLVANLSEKPDLWVGDLFDEKSEKRTKKYLRIKQSLTYNFTRDILTLNDDFVSSLQVNDSDFPHIITLYLEGNIDITTLIIINKCFDVINRWDKKISDQFVYPLLVNKIKNLSPFYSIDRDKYIAIIKDHFQNDSNTNNTQLQAA